MRKLLQQVIRPYVKNKTAGELCFSQRCPVLVRQYYNNTEFLPGGYAKTARGAALHAGLPDPLGNLLIVFAKDFQMPTRSSSGASSVSIPDNRSRGWSNLSLKTHEQQNLH